MLSSTVVGYERESILTMVASKEQRRLSQDLAKLSLASDEHKSCLREAISERLRTVISINLTLTKILFSIFPDIPPDEIPALKATYADIKLRLEYYRLNVCQLETFYQMKVKSTDQHDFCQRVYGLYTLLILCNAQCLTFLNMLDYLAPHSSETNEYSFLTDKSFVISFIKHDKLSQQLVTQLATELGIIERMSVLLDENVSNSRFGF